MAEEKKKTSILGRTYVLISIVCLACIRFAELNYVHPPKMGLSSDTRFVISFLLFAFAMVMLVTAGNTIKYHFHQKKLVTSGPFAKVRNPIYSSYILGIFPANAIAIDSWFTLVCQFVLMYIIGVIMLRSHEQKMESVFGKEYLDYKEKTPIFIPKLW